MKILFQGGWKSGRNPDNVRQMVIDYCRALGKRIVASQHSIILTSCREFDKIVADAVVGASKECGKNPKDYLIFMLPERDRDIPCAGRVVMIPEKYWWIEERTYSVQKSDAVLAICGGKGTYDCLDKALLARKPIFVTPAISSRATDFWNSRPKDFHYINDGDSEVFDDINVSPEEFFQNVFLKLDELNAKYYSRNVFVVHGHDHFFRDQLVDVLRTLGFIPIVLQNEPNRSLAIIEKLEQAVGNVGYAFVLYTADDLGRQKEGMEKYRARQNVVFEHGLLIGLLGRDRTCAVIKGDLEIPSDISGMLHESISNFRDEALRIAKILKSAGYSVDASNLI